MVTTSGLTAIAVGGTPSAAHAEERNHGSPRSDPFTLGIASGDPSPDGFVLWTRLAAEPLAEDGLGGMPSRNFDVEWQLATDEQFTDVIGSGVAVAGPEWGYSVHVELSGLEADRVYFYRFRVDRFVSPIGRTRTSPAFDVLPSGLHIAVTSCSNFEHGYFTAYRRMAEERPDLILHLGDYQYEYKKDEYVSPDGNVRDHEGPETETLANYRQRHAQYKTDLDLQAAHAIAPWIAVLDDHELDNNWADEIHEKPDIPQPDFLARREAAFRAYYENMPLRSTSIPSGIDMQLYRRVRWGRLANFHMMDTRQYRDDQACDDGWKTCPEADDPARTITGAEQQQWLLDGLAESEAVWDFLGQQVFFAQRDREAGPVKVTSMDGWDGYTASRRAITEGWVAAGVPNPVVLTGDVHTAWANELKLDYDDPTGPSVGVEIVATSITSGGNGVDSIPEENPFLQINPHIKFFNEQRGYVSARVDSEQLAVDFVVVPKVTETDAPAHIRASYVVENGDPTLHPTYSRPVDEANRQRFDPNDPLKTSQEDAADRV